MGRPRAGEPELARDVIVNAALEILRTEDFAAMTLSRIAAVLNVRTPALYWYFKNRADLYTYVTEELFRRTALSIDPDLSGRDLLWAFGRALRAQQREIRGATKLISIADVSDEVRTTLVPDLLSRIAGDDITTGQARRYLTAIQALTLGWSTFEHNPATLIVMREGDDGDAAYEEALARLIFAPGKAPDPPARPPHRRIGRRMRKALR